MFLVLTEFSLFMNNLLGQIKKLSGDRMDLSRKIYITSFDDIGSITEGTNRIISNLRNTFSRVRKMNGLMDGMASGIRAAQFRTPLRASTR
jgi:methyl-accepting chemotaxis protein